MKNSGRKEYIFFITKSLEIFPAAFEVKTPDLTACLFLCKTKNDETVQECHSHSIYKQTVRNIQHYYFIIYFELNMFLTYINVLTN